MGGGLAGLPGPAISVQVLTTGSWPTQAGARCNLPSEILPMCERFSRHYLGTHTGRKLTWQTNMGSADMKATFEGRKYELSVSTYQVRGGDSTVSMGGNLIILGEWPSY